VKDIVSALLVTATLALAATPIQAQPLAQRDSSQERQDSRSDEHRLWLPWGIVGSWFGTTATGIRQLITFHADGTALRSVQGEASVNPAFPPHTPQHGVWRYLGRGRFGVTMWDLFYDVNTGQPLRYMKTRLEVTLDDRDHASARAILETIDLQGVVLQTRTGSVSYMRIPFEPFE
jgi:hypothetical protein